MTITSLFCVEATTILTQSIDTSVILSACVIYLTWPESLKTGIRWIGAASPGVFRYSPASSAA
jgi:hypothetical protein